MAFHESANSPTRYSSVVVTGENIFEVTQLDILQMVAQTLLIILNFVIVNPYSIHGKRHSNFIFQGLRSVEIPFQMLDTLNLRLTLLISGKFLAYLLVFLIVLVSDTQIKT